MKLKTLTWNIGGGKVLQENADPTLLASYTQDGLEDIIKVLQQESPDIITLQETHKNANVDQVAYIAEKLGYNFVHDTTSDSHIDTDFQLGHAILTRFPLQDHRFEFFVNPKVQITWEDGSTATSFDKGFTTCTLDCDGTPLAVTTLHLIPFRRFDIALDSEQAKAILDDVQTRIIGDYNPWLIQGDFNINSTTVKQCIPQLFDDSTNEVELPGPTTPKGHKYDHIMCRGGTITDVRIIDDVLTDHFPVVATIEL